MAAAARDRAAPAGSSGGCELAEVLRRYGDDYVRTHPTRAAQRKAMRAIERCRTAALKLLFDATAGTLLEFGRRDLGGTVGFTHLLTDWLRHVLGADPNACPHCGSRPTLKHCWTKVGRSAMRESSTTLNRSSTGRARSRKSAAIRWPSRGRNTILPPLSSTRGRILRKRERC
jgi:hypothetical protein